MGQTPSNHELDPEWSAILETLTREDIIRASSRCRSDPLANDAESKRVNIDDDVFDLDDFVPQALAILQAHPQLKDLRFRLVPSRLTEEIFWAAIFSILDPSGSGEAGDADSGVGDDYSSGDEIDDLAVVVELERLRSPRAAQPSPSSSNSENDTDDSNNGLYASPSFYLEEINGQKLFIARLQKGLREANHKIRKLGLDLHKVRLNASEDQPSESKTPCALCNSKLVEKPSPHTGEWKVHKDCEEFLKLDEHLKGNLRKEKEKRLKEVREQMKFILDTDDVRGTHGEWSCCGNKEYDADCQQA